MSDPTHITEKVPRTSRRTTHQERGAIIAIAAATGFIVGSAGAAPTGIGFVDFLYAFAAGSLLAISGGRAGRQALMVSAVLSLWAAPGNNWRLLAFAAVGIGAWMAATERRRWAGVVAAGTIAVVLAHLGSGPFHGSTVLWSTLIATPLVISASMRVLPSQRRALIAATSTVLSLASAASLVFLLTAMFSLGDVRLAIDDARSGFNAAADGDEPTAGLHFNRAATGFESTRSRFAGFWLTPARLVPVVGQHLRAVQVLSAEGVNLSSTAAATTRAVDPDEIRLDDGRIDLALLDELSPVLDRADAALGRALERTRDVDSEWLAQPMARRVDDLLEQLTSVQPAAHTAALAASEVPTMLGADRPVNWLVLLTTPAEARGLGGLIGNYSLVTADDGRLQIGDSGRNEDLNRLLSESDSALNAPLQYTDRWSAYSPHRFFQDITLSPDLPMVAAVAADLFEQAKSIQIDGVIVVDPYAVGALIELTGPIEVDEREFDPRSAIDFLISGQYLEFADDEPGRVMLLDGLVTETFAAITTRELFGPRLVADKLGPSVDQGRLSVWWSGGGRPSELLESAGLDNRFPEPDGHDLIGVVHQNAGQNKIDVFLERSIDYRLDIQGGRAVGTVTVTLRNTAPASGLPAAVIGNNDQGFPFGTNVALVSIHTALPITAGRVDGIDTAFQRSAAFGGEAHTVEVEIGPGQTGVIEVDLAGDMAGSDYRLMLVPQPLVRSDTVSVHVENDGVTVVEISDLGLLTDTIVGAS